MDVLQCQEFGENILQISFKSLQRRRRLPRNHRNAEHAAKNSAKLQPYRKRARVEATTKTLILIYLFAEDLRQL